MDPDAIWGGEWVRRGMDVLDGAGDRRMERGQFGDKFGRPIVTNGDGDALFPNYFGEDLLRSVSSLFVRPYV